MSLVPRSSLLGAPARSARGARVGAAALALTLVVTAACKKSDADADAEAKAEMAGKATTVPVQTATLQLASFADTTKVFGSLAPLETVTITSEMQGRIEYLPVDDGSRVKKGQTLARINARTTTAQLKQAQATYDMQKVETERTRKLVEKKLSPPQQLDVAEAQLKQAEAAVELIEANLAKAIIRAPISGIVVQVNADEGEVASMGLPLLTIIDISSVVVAADVPERDVALMKSGQAVPVKVEAFPDQVFPGVIGYIDYVANTTTHTFLMKIRIENKEGLLRPGMLASLELDRRTYEDVVVAPRDAVIDDLDGKVAYVLDGDVARQRPVILGPTRGPFAVVTSGLTAGEHLIVNGHRQVVDGQKVVAADAGPCCKAQVLANEGPMPALGELGEATLKALQEHQANGKAVSPGEALSNGKTAGAAAGGR